MRQSDEENEDAGFLDLMVFVCVKCVCVYVGTSVDYFFMYGSRVSGVGRWSRSIVASPGFYADPFHSLSLYV